MRINETFARSDSDKLFFEMNNIEEHCNEKIISTNEGLYLLEATKAKSLRRSNLTLTDIQDLSLADADYRTVQNLEFLAQIQKSLCHQALNIIKTFSTSDDEYIEINDIKGNPIILYASNNKVYIPHCMNINEISIVASTIHCYKDIPITFMFQNRNISSFLQNDKIIKRHSKLINCKAIDQVMDLSHIQIRRNSSFNTIESRSKTHSEILNLLDTRTQNFNFHHLQQIIESVDILDDVNRFFHVSEMDQKFIISSENHMSISDKIVHPAEAIVEKANQLTQSAKDKINQTSKIIIIIFSCTCLIFLFLVLIKYRTSIFNLFRTAYNTYNTNKSNGKDIELVDSIQPLKQENLFPNLNKIIENAQAPPNESLPPIYSDADDYNVSLNAKKFTANIVKQLGPTKNMKTRGRVDT